MQVSYIKPDIKTVEPSNPYSLDLMGRMLMDKAQRYESNFAKMQSEIDMYANQQFINGATKQYADQKLKSIVDTVNGMGGVDLSDFNQVQKIQNVKSEFSRDPRIVNGIADTQKIKSLQEKYQKDLEKNPGNIVNYTLFQQDVNGYANDASEGARYKGMDFMTYVDVDKSMQTMMDKLKADGILKQTSEPGKYIYTTTNEQVDGDRVEQIVYNHLQSNASVMAQVRNNARFYMQNTPDANLAEMFQGYSQQRVAEKAGSIKKIDQLIKQWQAEPSSAQKDATLAQLNKQLEFSKKDYDKYEKFASSPEEIAKQIATGKQSVWEELHTNSLVNKYKSIYAYSKDGSFKVDDVSDPYLKAAASAKKVETDQGTFIREDNAIVFDAQDGTTGVRDISSSSLAADVTSAMDEKSALEKTLIADIKLKTGSAPADLNLYIKQQEDKIMKKEQLDPEYIDFRQKYINANHRIENAAAMLKRYNKEAEALYKDGGIQDKLPNEFRMASGISIGKKDMIEFMQNYGKDIRNMGWYAGADEREALNRKIMERSSGPIAEGIRNKKIDLLEMVEYYQRNKEVFGFVEDYMDKNLKQAVTSRIPMLVFNDKQKNDVQTMGQLTGLIAHDRQMQKLESVKNVVPIKYGYDKGNLMVTYQYEDEDKNIQTETTRMLKADQTPNAFGGLLEQDPYEDMRNTVMFRGSTSPDGDVKTGSYKNTAPVVQVPYMVKNDKGQMEKKFKSYYLRFTDRNRARVYDEGSNPISALPDSGINLDYFQFVDPDDPTGWLPMVNDEKRMLPPVKTVSQAMAAAQTYLQSLTQLKATQNIK